MLVRAFLSEALELVQNEPARALFEEMLHAWWQDATP